jgi:hypothetical protein
MAWRSSLMKPLLGRIGLSGYRHIEIERKLVQEFGDGTLKGDEFLFDQLTAVPGGWVDKKGTAAELLGIVQSLGEVLVLFDRHPSNHPWVVKALTNLGFPILIAGQVNAEELARLLACDRVDMYVTTIEGELLAVACHEYEEVDGARKIHILARRD